MQCFQLVIHTYFQHNVYIKKVMFILVLNYFIMFHFDNIVLQNKGISEKKAQIFAEYRKFHNL